jgi:hypothetical protein
VIAQAFWHLVLVVMFVTPQGPGSYEVDAWWPTEEECYAQGFMQAREIRAAQAQGHPPIVRIDGRCEPPPDPGV